jgi:choice-of-anchor C domain-containing protein
MKEVTKMSSFVNNRKVSLCLTVASVLVPNVVLAQATNLAINGSFENSVYEPVGEFRLLPAGATGITGWTVRPADIDYIGWHWISSDGVRSIDLSGQEAGGIMQDIATTMGSTYLVEFDLAGNPNGGYCNSPPVKTLRVSAAGQWGDFSFDTTGRSGGFMGWAKQQWTFVATGSATTLAFDSTCVGPEWPWPASGYGPAIDNVSVFKIADADQPPEITALSGPLEPVQVGALVTVGASFSDLDAGDTHTAVWEWGDGTSATNGDVNEVAQTVSGSHTYTAAGVYTVTLTVTDAAGASDSDEIVIVVEDTFYLHGVAPDLTLDDIAPTGTTAEYQDSPGVNRTTFKEIGTWTYVVPPGVNLRRDAARDLYVWLGLKNSDDQGTYFDLRAELLRNEALIASAQTTNIQGITRNPNKAKEVVVAFDAVGDGAFSPGDVLALRILTKVTDVGGHSSAVGLRLYYDSLSRPSRFEPSSVP